MVVVDLDDVPAYRDQSHDHDHFDTYVVFAEINLERFDELQAQQNNEHPTERTLHHGVEITRIRYFAPARGQTSD